MSNVNPTAKTSPPAQAYCAAFDFPADVSVPATVSCFDIIRTLCPQSEILIPLDCSSGSPRYPFRNIVHSSKHGCRELISDSRFLSMAGLRWQEFVKDWQFIMPIGAGEDLHLNLGSVARI